LHNLLPPFASPASGKGIEVALGNYHSLSGFRDQLLAAGCWSHLGDDPRSILRYSPGRIS